MGTANHSRFADLVRGDEVHRSIYTDPEVFAEEMRRIFGRTWVFVGHESEVPHPGDYKTDHIAQQPIIMTRHTDGRIYVLFNACRHRGAVVCQLPRGNAKQFRCLYHGWTYKSNGDLVGVPLRSGFGSDFDPSAYGLIPVPRVASYRGFVFANLGREGPDLDTYLGRAKHYLDILIDRAPDQKIHATKPLKYEFAGNWKLQLENYSCNYHPLILHQSTFEVGLKIMAEKYGQKNVGLSNPEVYSVIGERSLAYGHGVTDYRGSRGMLWRGAFDDPEYIAALEPRYRERAREVVETDVHIMIFPNLLLHARLCHYRVIKPLSVNHTEINTYPCKMQGAPATVNDTIVRYTSQHVSAGGEVQVDDLKAFASVQAGLRVGALDWLPFKLYGKEEHVNEYGERIGLGVSEMIQRGYYREWARLMAEL